MNEWNVGDQIVILNVNDINCLKEMSLEPMSSSADGFSYAFKNGANRVVFVKMSKQASYIFDVLEVAIFGSKE